ncbi:MAG: RAMP superfamily CRISPR-associated protein [Thermodesulfovibrionales bacterium]
MKLKIEIQLLTPSLIGSGTGYGTIIDADIVFDEIGIPLIPAKRIKGCLRDSAIELLTWFKLAGIQLFDQKMIDIIFGKPGNIEPGSVYFSNLFIDEYEKIKTWAIFLSQEVSGLINKESIIDYFTELRQQTAIDEESGTAKKHSLRTIRVAKKGLIFKGDIEIHVSDAESAKRLLYYAAKNLRHLGTKRTRGFGYVRCRLLQDNNELDFINELEGLCRA